MRQKGQHGSDDLVGTISQDICPRMGKIVVESSEGSFWEVGHRPVHSLGRGPLIAGKHQEACRQATQRTGFEPGGAHEHQGGNHLWLRAYEAMPVGCHPGGDMHLCEPQMLEESDEPPGNSTFCIHGHRSVSCLKCHTCPALSSQLSPYLAAVSYASPLIRSTAWCMPSPEKWLSISHALTLSLEMRQRTFYRRQFCCYPEDTQPRLPPCRAGPKLSCAPLIVNE